MYSNLPVKKEESFFEKIKIFFRRLFYKNQSVLKEEKNLLEQDNNEKEFLESIQIKNNTDYMIERKREAFLDEIEKKPMLLYDLSIEKLEKLENYYKLSIKKHEQKLAMLKKAN